MRDLALTDSNKNGKEGEPMYEQLVVNRSYGSSHVATGHGLTLNSFSPEGRAC